MAWVVFRKHRVSPHGEDDLSWRQVDAANKDRQKLEQIHRRRNRDIDRNREMGALSRESSRLRGGPKARARSPWW